MAKEKKTQTRFDRYNKKCKMFSIRFILGKDDKYIAFMKECPNRMEFIREAIDKAIAES